VVNGRAIVISLFAGSSQFRASIDLAQSRSSGQEPVRSQWIRPPRRAALKAINGFVRPGSHRHRRFVRLDGPRRSAGFRADGWPYEVGARPTSAEPELAPRRFAAARRGV